MSRDNVHTEKVNESDPLQHNVTAGDLVDFDGFLLRITDIPASKPFYPLPITSVGIIDRQVILQVPDFLNPDRCILMSANVEVHVDLDPESRGIHMSRIEESLRAVGSNSYRSADEYACRLAQDVALRQGTRTACVNLRGTVLVDRPAPKTGLISSDPFVIMSHVRWSKSDGTQKRSGLVAYNITACPCTRAFSKYSQVPHLSERYSIGEINDILNNILTYTHCQRGSVNLLVDNDTDILGIGDLYGVLDESTHLVYNLLKRPDEHELVRRAHERPQFTEDVVREVCAKFLDRYQHLLPTTTMLTVESQLMESIHIHSVHSKIESSIGELSSCLNIR